MRFAELVNHRIFERKWRSREILRACLFECPLIKKTLNYLFLIRFILLFSRVCYYSRGNGSCWVRPCQMFNLSGGVTLNLVHHWRASSQNTGILFIHLPTIIADGFVFHTYLSRLRDNLLA